jgi:hypothetical protein
MSTQPEGSEYPYYWNWRTSGPPHGTPCRIVCGGVEREFTVCVVVEFADGTKRVTPRAAIRRRDTRGSDHAR